MQTSGFDWIVYFFHFGGSLTVCGSWFVVVFYFFLILCFFLEIFWVSPFCTMSFCIDSSALMLLSLFHFGSCRLLLFIFGNFGVLPIFSDSTCTVTYCRRLMLLRLGTSSVITSQTAWFACLIDSSTFLFTDILGRRGLSSIMIFSHSVFAFLISLIRSSISDGLHDGSTSSSYVAS